MFVRMNPAQQFTPAPPVYYAPVQPVYYVRAQWPPKSPTVADYINPVLNEYLRNNWQDMAKWALRELLRPEPTARSRRARRRR
jgi:hypothetical protein